VNVDSNQTALAEGLSGKIDHQDEILQEMCRCKKKNLFWVVALKKE